MYGIEIPKQRGIYSEILTTEDTENLRKVSTFGPDEKNLCKVYEVQQKPRAIGIKKKKKIDSHASMTAGLIKNIVGKDFYRDDAVNAGHYSKKREGVADVDPKVMEPYQPIPGKPPRKVVIDRQRKLFASLDIEELLLEFGIDYRNPVPTPADWLALEPFDDTEYDSRLPEEWISYGEQPDGSFHPIPGKGLCQIESENGFYWRPVLIHTYEKEQEKFTGYWDGTQQYVELTRINLLFDAEDPRIFAQRVVQAHSERVYADSQIRYNFFIDFMPFEELPEPDTEQKGRIQKMATASRALKTRTAIDQTNILSEVMRDFRRTMNQIIMEETMNYEQEREFLVKHNNYGRGMAKDYTTELIPTNLKLPPRHKPKEVPYFGLVPIPPHDFPEQFSTFCFNSLFIKPEVITAMVEIRSECNKVLQENRIFNTRLRRVIKVEEFKQQQTGSRTSLQTATGPIGWCDKMTKIIKSCFKDVGKGWFNLNVTEDEKESYEFGKLKKFLSLVNFMMQDTVLNLCKYSVYEFVDYMKSFIPDETLITSASIVTNKFPKRHTEDQEEVDEDGDQSDSDIPIHSNDLPWAVEIKRRINKEFAKNKNPDPLFQLDLIRKANQLVPQYNNNPKEIVAKIKQIFEDGIKCLQEIPHLEQMLLKQLFKTQVLRTIKTPVIPADKPLPPDPNDKTKFLDENAWLYDAFEDLIANLERAILPLVEYVETYRAFDAENNLDPDKYVAKFCEEGEGKVPATPSMIRDDVYKQFENEKKLTERIPSEIQVSMFLINCKDIRNAYQQKYAQIREKDIKLIAQIAKDNTHQLAASFTYMENRILKTPETIEDLCNTKQFIADQGVEIEKKKKEINDVMETYKILDEFNYDLSYTDQQEKWHLFGCPRHMVRIMESQTLVLEKLKETMLKQMQADQEEFVENIANLEQTILEFEKNKRIDKYADIAASVDEVDKKITECIETARRFNSNEVLVGSEVTDYKQLMQLSKDFKPYSDMWKTARTWFNGHKNWMTVEWEKLDAPELEQTWENCQKTINTVFRQFRDRNQAEMFKIAETIKKQVDDFKTTVPLAVALRKEGMKDRHWDAISSAVGFDIRPNDNFTLTTVIEKGMLNHIEIADEIGEKAFKEYNIEKQLKKMKKEWEGLNFLLPRFKQTPTYTIAGFDEAINLLDEHIVSTQAMQFSVFKKPFEQEIEEWNAKLLLASDTLEQWVACQGQWAYLQPIFDSADIMKQLPAETKRFKGVDIKWRYIMNQCKENPSILDNCSKDGHKESFFDCNKNLELVQKGLKEYLEKKRSNFARFYFLSDDDLLEILSQTKEVRRVRSHLRKVFEAIADLEFRDDDCMVAMMSVEGEKVEFVKRVDPKERNVEYWMWDVEKQMVMSVREIFHQALLDYPVQDRNHWVITHAGQIVLNASQVVWTNDVERELKEKGHIKDYLAFLSEQLNQSVMLVRQKLTKLAKISVNALIVIDVHARDVIQKMADKQISDVGAFEWIQQLRYYWIKDEQDIENTICKCVATVFPYGYEYLGNTGRLVITPLTDVCYITLMGALDLNLGGAPAGPAGTGKTESTKDLAKALAKQCVVFNCSGDMTHTMVATFFKGLSASGAWCCFDEFNRINIEVLSVIAQYLLQLFGSKARNDPEINFEGSLIKMKPTFCVFITMNPGYAGRTELPDNLQALFRPVAMMVPDYAMIGEIMLYSFGFLRGRILAKKMVTTFTLSSEQLSSQDHYDYGMRAVRSVINAAGQLKSAYPDMDEDQLLLRALRDVNVPKFLADDLPLFENIILDLFPGVNRPEQVYGPLVPMIHDTCVKENLQPVDAFITKIIQLYDTIMVRHGLMIVGPTGGGKTSNWKVLQKAISNLAGQESFQKVNVNILNPKSITMGQLYGFVDPASLEWQDGVLAKLVLEASKDETPEKFWILFDGPVDALWIENMNTVLDDNKKLCLNSGQIIQLTERMTMMFEVEDLAVASPATVSRCGMVYMEPESLGLTPFVASWMNVLPPKVKANQFIVQTLNKLFTDTLDDGAYFVRKNCPEIVKTVSNNLGMSCMRLLDCFMNGYIETEARKVTADNIDNLASMVKQIYITCFVWSLGATTTQLGRERFDKWMRDQIKIMGVQFPEQKTVYDWYWNQELKEWQSWMATIPAYNVDIKLPYNEIVVPTLDSIRMKYLLKTLICNMKHVLTPGPTGVGKSVYIQELTTFEMTEEYQTLKMSFSAQTSANQTQDFIDDKCEKRRMRVYGPPNGKRFIIFVDDMNMPAKEQFGAQPPIELLRQFADHGGWYDRKSKEKPFNRLVDIILVATMGPPGGGRSVVTQRMQRQFNILSYTDMQFEAITTIFKTILDAFYFNFTDQVKKAIDPLIEIQLEVYDQVLNGPLKPTPNKSHYTFNLRDISKIFGGCVIVNNKSVMTSLHLNRLWIHENKRVFGDRLNDNPDRKFMNDLLLEKVQAKFALSKIEIFNSERIIFGDFMDGIDVETRVYRQLDDLRGMQTKIEDYLEDYNSNNKVQMPLVMFLDACDHVARIQRIIRQPLGNAFLLGVGGSGRQSLARLATFIANQKVFQIEVVKGYGMGNWREDVKKVLMQAGVDNKPTSFIFVDTQILDEQMLEDINNILNGGDVPNLYKLEDMEPILKVGKNECMDKGITLTKMNMFMAYLSRIVKNTHMIIAMSPLGDIFRARLRNFPSLVTCCTLDWFSEWPEDALLGVGKGQIAQRDIDLGDDLDSCVEMFKVIHQSVEMKSVEFKEQLNRVNWVTPTSFLEQLSMYVVILKQKRSQNTSACQRLIIGLDVLEKAATAIDVLKTEIARMQPELEATKKQLAITMADLSVKKEAAEIDRDIVAKDEAEARTQEMEAEALKNEAETELAKATPLLQEAEKVLKEIKKDDLYFIQSLKQPSANIVLVMEFCCHMFSHKPKKQHMGKSQNDAHGYFEISRLTLLSNPNQFLKDMINYDKDNQEEKTVKKVNAMLANPSFSMSDIYQASPALMGIMKWVKAMVAYHELLKIVNPKRARVAEMNEKLGIVRARLAEKRKKLAEVEEMMAMLQAQYEEKLENERTLVAKIDDSNKKLFRANKIILGLADEKIRWSQTVARLKKEETLLVGDCLVAAGMIAYSGPFTAKFRTELETEWHEKISQLGVKVSDGVSMKKIMEDPVTTKTWTIAQLPSDNLSIENAIIIFTSRRWPLMIDPQNQANKFIKNLSKDKDSCPHGIYYVKMSDPSLMRQLETAIQSGDWFLVENVGEELDPVLEPILSKQIDKAGTIRIGDKQVPYDKQFKFFMTTTLPNPNYTPETQVKVTLLNFAITPAGLEEQMLYQFVIQEMPDQQKRKDLIVAQNAQAAKSLRDIEEKILEGLTKNKEIAAILESDDLIVILDNSKITADEINTRLKESAIAEKEIDESRERYREVAFRAQILFFTIVDLAVIDPMYQYSLQWFAQLFAGSIDNSPGKNQEAAVRIKSLNDHFTLALYDNVCRSLFESSKLLFSFKMTVNILDGFDLMDAQELRFLLAGPSGEIKIQSNPTNWLDDLTWTETAKQLVAMSSVLPAFKSFDKYFIENHLKFKLIFDSLEPQNEKLPGEWETKLNTFQKLIIIKALRPDKITLGAANFVIEHLGQPFVEPPVFNLSKSFKDSSITTPLIFILSKGTDPVASFERFAEESNMSKKCEKISLGRGQGPKAEQMIIDNLNRGGWVLLMNCHLSVSWMPKLEAIVESIDDTKHRDFRLWLTSMPNPSFPVSILQNSVKMTLEPPSGLRSNVLQTYEALSPEEFEECTKPEVYKKLLFGFCFFHAIVQDRRKFGPIGWNIPYAFTNEDLIVSRRQLKKFVEAYDDVPYEVLNMLGAQINYGGRVTQKQDIRLIRTIIESYINPEILIVGHKFSTSGKYYSLQPGDKEDYMDYIKTLPLNPDPEAFGLHDNAQITTSQIATTNLLEGMIMMQPKVSTGKGKSREEIIGEMAKFLQDKTPEIFDLEKIGKKYPTAYEESMNTVLFQECVRYNGLLAEMKVSLIKVQKALVGEVVMSGDLEKMATQIFDNQVPIMWMNEGEGLGFLSQKPLASWIIDCNDRIKFLQKWYDDGTPNVYWVSGFFFPQAFFTGTLQNYARKHTIAIDELTFGYKYEDQMSFQDVKKKPESGCYLYGMYLEGCKWDYNTHQIAESDPKKLFVEMPMIHFIPIQNRVIAKTGIYNCPVYKTLVRNGTLSTTGHSTNYVLDLELPSTEEQAKWIKAGVACFLALKY